MSTFEKTGRYIVFCALALALLACEQPFKAGLGAIVDLRPPTIAVDEPGAGSYIRGVVRFRGTAEDDYKLESAEFRVANFPETINRADGSTNSNPYFTWKEIRVDSSGKMYFDVDTTYFDDGEFQLKLRARDSSGKTAETDEITYFIKNNPPTINMALPLIDTSQSASGTLNGPHLNWVGDEAEFNRPLDASGVMVGMVYDREGVYRGEAKTIDGVEWFPPQIRFWQIADSSETASIGLFNSSDIKIIAPNAIPSESEVSWQPLRQTVLGLTDVMVSYSLPKLAERYYAFQIRAQSVDGTTFYYPKDHWSEQRWDALSEIQQTENSAVTVFLNSPEEPPTVSLWGLEAIDRPDGEGWNSSTSKYNDYTKWNKDEYHPYFSDNSSKNGPFTLRVKANHSQGISTAAVYFETANIRGRFIWDFADGAPAAGWSNWDSGNSVPRSQSYIYWGRNDPHSTSPANTPPIPTRNFVFTYNDAPGGGRVSDNDLTVDFAVRNSMKVQTYRYPLRWFDSSNRLNQDTLEFSDAGDWEDFSGRLPEGEYKIWVTARSISGTPMTDAQQYTLFIDRGPPAIEFNNMTGGFVGTIDADPKFDSNNPTYIVNGVVEPRFLISDSRAVDSSLRLATDIEYFRNPLNSAFGFEQLFVVVHDKDKRIENDNKELIGGMDFYLEELRNNNDWLHIPAKSGTLVIPGVKVWKDGPIFEAACKFKASPIYNDGSENDILEDGEKYWIYVIARDNAFNIGYNAFPILVDYQSDLPMLDFSAGSIDPNVTEPNYGDPNSFEQGGRVRNAFGSNSEIQLWLRDDDGLDLGVKEAVPGSPTPAERTSVKVTMIGSQVVHDDPAYPQGKIISWPETPQYLIELTDKEVKDAHNNAPDLKTQVIRERLLKINQSVLLDALKRHAASPLAAGAYDYLFTEPVDSYYSLPDGLYRITIEVSDSTEPLTKLKVDSGDPDAAKATASRTFWIAVDNKPPQIDRDTITPANGSFVTLDEVIKGKVRDENGPLTAGSLKVTGSKGGNSADLSGIVTYGPVKLVPLNITQDVWEYEFQIPFSIEDHVSLLYTVFDFEVSFRDRFGIVETRLPLTYLIDNDPPNVRLIRAIDTFARAELTDDIVLAGTPGMVSTEVKNKGHLANEVLSFAVNATDNLQVEGVRWWLLRADTEITGPLLANMQTGLTSTGGLVTDYDAWPSSQYDRDPGTPSAPNPSYIPPGRIHEIMDGGTVVGYFGEIDRGNPYVYIDSNASHTGVSVSSRPYEQPDYPKLPDGEYRLHIIARDSAGNESRNNQGNSIMQEIFVLQDQDKPFFDEMPPGDMVVGANGLVLRGTIYEDDGFTYVDNGSVTIRDDAVTVWFNSNSGAATPTSNPGLLDPAIDPTTIDLGYSNRVDLERKHGMSALGRNLNLNVRLVETEHPITHETIDGLFLETFFYGDGRKHFLIEATDSPTNKWRAYPITAPTGPDPYRYYEGDDGWMTNRVKRRAYFDFIYDTIPPVLEISQPANGSTFGKTAPSLMDITGYIEDANLLPYKVPGYPDNSHLNYEITYRLGSGAIKTWNLGRTVSGPFTDRPYITAITTDVNGVVKVEFVIPAALTVEDLGFDGLKAGMHMLDITVEDASGKAATSQIMFIKDETPPNATLINIDELSVDQAEIGTIGDWWDETLRDPGALTSIQAWKEARWKWLDGRGVSVISYDAGSGLPVLFGTFDDDTSDIDTASFMYWIDDDDTSMPGRTDEMIWDGAGTNYRWSLPLLESPGGAALADGFHTIKFVISDVPGNELESAMFVFRINSGQPELEITAPANDVFGMNTGFTDTVFTIKGTASGPNIQSIQLQIVQRGGSGSPIVETEITASNTDITLDFSDPTTVKLNWQYDFTRDGGFNTLTDGGRYDVRIVAEDYRGNRSDEEIWTFTKDTTPPDIRFPGMITDNADILFNNLKTTDTGTNANVIMSESVRIQGTVIDHNNTSAITRLESMLDQWDWTTGAWLPVQPWGSVMVPDESMSTNVPWEKDYTYNYPYAVLDGTDYYWYVENVKTNKKYEPGDTVSATGGAEMTGNWQVNSVNLLDAASAPIPVIHRAEGAYRMRLRAKDSAWIEFDPDSADWTAGTGGGNPVQSEWLYFFYDRYDPSVEITSTGNFFSSRRENEYLPFDVIISDANRLSKITADIVHETNDIHVDYTTAPTITVENQNTADGTWTGDLRFRVLYGGLTGTGQRVPDGTYRVKVTAVDMAGRSTTKYKTFTLDNTPPTGRVLTPRPFGGYPSDYLTDPNYEGFRDGSITEVLGGQNEEISGDTTDANGIAGLWYHIGFLDDQSSGFPDQDDLALSVLPGNTWGTTPYDSGYYDQYFDDAVAAAGNRWFKLGVNAPPDWSVNNNVYDWSMKIPNIVEGVVKGGLKQYVEHIQIKGKWYNGSGEPQLTETVHQDIAKKSDIVRLPLWIRIADRAGNVSYFCRDIWFNPYGDIPNTTILNPKSAPLSSPRGGTITADGLAINNWSVYSVIFRVKADNVTTSTPENPGSAPADSDIVSLVANAGNLVTDPSELALLIDAGYGEGPWYHANLEGPKGQEVPWSFNINSEGEITNLIDAKGFNANNPSSTTGKDTIRVWLEVFAFRGLNEGAMEISHNPDGGGTISPRAPKPYVRVFYLNRSAPEILYPLVAASTIDPDTGDPVHPANIPANHYTGAGTQLRRGNFALRTTLNPSSTGNSAAKITKVSIRQPGEAYPDWVDVWEDGSNTGMVPGVTVATGTGLSANQYYFNMHLNSSVTAANPLRAGYGRVRNNAWAATGGTYTVEVRILDNSSPAAEDSFTFEIGIDNFAPVADLSVMTNSKVAGTNQDFMGRVFDYSNTMVNAAADDRVIAPRSIDRVYVWFTKNNSTDFVNINTGARSGTSTGTITALADRTAQVTTSGGVTTTVHEIDNPGTPDIVSYPATAAGSDQPFNVAGGWVREISEATAVTGSRMVWMPNGDASFRYEDVTWIMNINTLVLPDGPITLHYVVIDKIGNASHYKQSTMVRNKYPQIDKVTLYTDNNGIGAVFSGSGAVNNASEEYELRNFNMSTRGYLDTGFISKNKYIGFKVETSSGNSPLRYRVQYVTREQVNLDAGTLDEMIADRELSPDRKWSDVYTVAEIGDYTTLRWQNLGVNTTVTPPVGTNFVVGNFVTGTENEGKENYVPPSVGGAAKVWRYRLVSDIQKASSAKGRDIYDNNLPILPNDPGFSPDEGDGFNFKGDGFFNVNPGSPVSRIKEFKGSDPDGSSNHNDTAFFVIKAWDTVDPEYDPASTPAFADFDEMEQLYDAVVIGMNVWLEDTKPPTARLYDLNPYAETLAVNGNSTSANLASTIRRALDPRSIGENILRGGLYNDTYSADVELVPSGHIEPKNYTTGTTGPNPLYPRVKVGNNYVTYTANGFVAGDLPTNALDKPAAPITLDMVSGKVILRGQAWDDQLISEIRIYIGSDAAIPTSHDLYDPTSPAGKEMAILRLDTTGDAASNPTYGTLQPVSGMQAAVYEEFHWKNGHTVEWAYVWDTEDKPNASGAPLDNVGIWAAAIDKLGTTASGTTGNGLPSAPVTTDNYTTEVFKTTMRADIVPYIIRFERETPKFATVRSRQGWYSFYEGEGSITAIGYSLKGSGSTTMTLQYGAGGGSNLTLPVTYEDKNKIVFGIPDDPAVGGSTVSQSGKIILKVNNLQEALNHRTNADQSWNREDHATGAELWTNKPYAHIWRSRHRGDVPITYFGRTTGARGGTDSLGGLSRPSLALEYTGTTNAGRLTGAWGVYAEANVFYGQNNGAIGYYKFAGTPGEPYVQPNIAFNNGSIGTSAMVYNYETDGTPSLRISTTINFVGNTSGNDTAIMTTASQSPTRRFQYHSITRDGTNGHVSCYDSYVQSLRYGRAASSANLLIDGRDSGTVATGSIAASSNAGLFSAIDYDGTGPIIAYYDVANDTLRIAYASQAAPVIGSWTRSYVFPVGTPYHRGSGRYVSIKVDKANGIHLAFYNSAMNTVVYAYAANRSSPFTAYTVDTVVKGGTWTDVSVDDQGNPWIVYGTNRLDNYDGARIAYRTNANTLGGLIFTGAVNDKVTGANITGWEAVSVPADYTVNDDRLNIEVWPPTARGSLGARTTASWGNWDAAVGYGSDRFRLAYFYKPAWKDY